MKNARLIDNIGKLLMVLGSALYALALLWLETPTLIYIICGIYAASLLLRGIAWLGSKDERRAKKEAARARKAQANAA